LPTAMFKITAAAFAVGADIFNVGTGDGVTLARFGSGKPRKIHGIAVVGSTNAADCAFTLKAGGKEFGTFYNTTGGANVAPKMDSDLQPIYSEDIIPSGAPLVGMVVDAAASNDVVVLVSWEDRAGYGAGGNFRSDVVVNRGGSSGYRRSYSAYRPRRTTRRRRSSNY